MKAILVIFVMTFATNVHGEGGKYLTYDEFVRQVESGNIESVTLDRFSSINGVMTDGESTHPFNSYADTGSANDPLLTQFLKKHNVGVTMRDVSEPSHAIDLMTGFMFLLSPIVFLILMIVVIKKLNRILANQKDNEQEMGESHLNA